ncbi:Toxoplasma gondii family A protein [Toxoplasma gondii p89]|uniref:Toxoplasma gondii family A protein n=2 Tax=Toxoplasma gondii TaxID=5811 RepID=A0A2G8XRH3_TOXGO|nr:Toxoplasma gondii family A protein [Toxoplasma gondii p89]PIL97278.1 Toxoplasma gondii family A protein [Toxoplasma gondii COUG]
MEGQILRAVCLTLLVGALLSCSASEANERSDEVDFTATIPETGLARDVEQVFFLGPSTTLRVIDETAQAVYLPRANENTDINASEMYTVAYRYKNGACDFTQKFQFNDAFPGYSTPLWVREEQSSAVIQKGSTAKRVMYTFTNPPAEFLSGGLSFCVRFKTVLASESSSQTSTPSPTSSGSPSSGDSGSSPGPVGPRPEDGEEEDDKKNPGVGAPSEPEPSKPHGDGEGGPSGGPGSVGGSDNQSHLPGQPPSHADPNLPTENVSGGGISDSPAPTRDRHESHSPEGPKDEGAHGGAGIDESQPDSHDKGLDGDQTHQNLGNLNSQTSADVQQHPESVEKPQGSVPVLDADYKSNAQKEPPISGSEENLTDGVQHKVPTPGTKSKHTADDTRVEGSGLTTEEPTGEEPGRSLGAANQETENGFLSRHPVISPSAEDSSSSVTGPTLMQEQGDKEEVEGGTKQEAHHQGSEEHPPASSAEHSPPSKPPKETNEANGDVAHAPVALAEKHEHSDRAQVHVPANAVTSNQSIEDSPAENTEAIKGGSTHNEAGEELAVVLGEKSGAAVRRLADAADVEEAYLTIIVHSSAWGFTSGITTLSVLVLAVTATLLSVF